MDSYISNPILKSSRATLGTTKLYQLCQDLKDTSQDNTSMAAPLLVSEQEVEYEPITASLQAQQRQ
ncbi:MAG TPA: hypothetical protein DCE56_23910 [Cyanobacteria bacterium UBA8553]|nr:hypothetical protein [Cyanobacteria bacterium UBA8553]HAJ60001.1 hypothetical protein [Cyanobacteria bacterium UBA8543]